MILKTILLYKHLHFLDFTNSSNKIILYKDTSTGDSNMPSQKNFAKTQKKHTFIHWTWIKKNKIIDQITIEVYKTQLAAMKIMPKTSKRETKKKGRERENHTKL